MGTDLNYESRRRSCVFRRLVENRPHPLLTFQLVTVVWLSIVRPSPLFAGPDELFGEARRCEDEAADPACALERYEQILREYPDARVAAAAKRRAEALRGQIGEQGEFAAQAKEMASLIAEAERLAPEEVVRRADVLGASAWPGAPEAALWVAEWLRRHERLGEARARFEAAAERWRGTRFEPTALRGAASAALEAHAWTRAEEMARRLPSAEEADRIVRDDLLAQAARGRARGRWYGVAWVIAIASLLGLAASLVEAGGKRRPALRPPVEVLFLAPVAAVLVAVAFTAHRLIAPAVATIAAGGVAMAWLSGAALDTLRARERPVRTRAIVHVVVCLVGIAALGYVVMTRDNLLDMVIETVKFGPEP